MSKQTLRKLAGFAAALVLIFAAAALAGATVGPDRDGKRSRAQSAGHTAMEDKMGAASTQAHKADPIRGLASSEHGLTLALERSQWQPGRSGTLSFAILGADRHPVRDFEVEHERRMHLIVVRRDGRGFQHLHPRMDRDGRWSVQLALRDPGSYRVFADFKRGGEAETLAADLEVDGFARYAGFPRASQQATTADGYRVRLQAAPVRAGQEGSLLFTVTRGGRAVHTEPYLGAGGHLVALREGDLAFLHVHPDEARGDGAVPFMTQFPSAGRYRLYLQFKHEGRVHTAEFTQEVSR